MGGMIKDQDGDSSQFDIQKSGAFTSFFPSPFSNFKHNPGVKMTREGVFEKRIAAAFFFVFSQNMIKVMRGLSSKSPSLSFFLVC
ncbi:hypothetical protein CEXT_397461 [Caerostris extrusa]|uniref:Uncharacterized protein n=1 Tax=Caerostris extrusa TaxID=172846 RepID=A0AAV4Q2P6_CAEEX|nr:hypothetical protein CEXT_397461 [Caerostris extrusa]